MPKQDFARRDYYDVWFPVLAPSADLMKSAQDAESDRQWAAFFRKFRSEMNAPAAAQSLDVLAALSKHREFLAGLLLRGRKPLSPLAIARAAAGKRRDSGGC